MKNAFKTWHLKKIFYFVMFCLVLMFCGVIHVYSQTPRLGEQTLLQQILNRLPAIPIAGNNLKFQFGGDTWIASLNGKNFLAGILTIINVDGSSIIILKQTHTFAALAWVKTPGPDIILEYKEGPSSSLRSLSRSELPDELAAIIYDTPSSTATSSKQPQKTTTQPVQTTQPTQTIQQPAVKPETFALDDFVYIQGGTFIMGSPVYEPERSKNEVQHQVTVSSFYIGKSEVTQREYQAVMGKNPSFFQEDNLPVQKVNWYEAIEYCNKRSQIEGLTPAYIIKNGIQADPVTGNNITITTVTWNKDANGFRLPTEAEWEYACRAETITPFNTGDNITTNQANYNGYPYNKNTHGINRNRTTPVESFAPNAWGLYGMHGNVQEWCWDNYGVYSKDLQTNPTGVSLETNRVIRGGSYADPAKKLRSAYRDSLSPYNRLNNVGFRLVLPLDQ